MTQDENSEQDEELEQDEGEGQDLAVLIPVDQDEIEFHKKYKLVAVRFEDGTIAVLLRSLCASLKLDRGAQVRRIKRTRAIADDLVSVRVQTTKGEQTLQALMLFALPFWFARLDTNRVGDQEMAEALDLFQRDCVRVLYRHFAERRPAVTPHSMVVPAEPITKPLPPTREAPAEEWIRFHERMADWLRWQQDLELWREDIEGWRSTVEDRLESVEAVTGLVPEIIERLRPQGLSSEHQRTVQASVNQLHNLSGSSHAAIYDALREYFHVGKYSDIPDAQWSEVATWFQARIDRARKK